MENLFIYMDMILAISIIAWIVIFNIKDSVYKERIEYLLQKLLRVTTGKEHELHLPVKDGLNLIVSERVKQLHIKDRTVANDVKYNTEGQLIEAVMMMLTYDTPEAKVFIKNKPPKNWNAQQWKKLVDKTYKEKLIVSGALIAAELDRLNFIENIPVNLEQT